MSLLVRTNGNMFPNLVDDLLNDTFVTPDLFDFNVNNAFRGLAKKMPSVNITETDREFKIELAAPGLEKNDFKVEVDKNLLTISSEKEEEKKEEDKNFYRREFSYNSFSRSFTLPENVLCDKIDAKYENGILNISIQKKEVAFSKPAKEIKVS